MIRLNKVKFKLKGGTKMKKKRVLALMLAAAMTFSLAACGNSDSGKKGDDGGKKDAETEETGVTLDQITLGEDYTDISADLHFLTNRTDIIDTTFADYIAAFQKMYPNVNIEYEGITDYANDVTTRLSTGDWGDICMIPTTVSKDDLGDYFLPLGDTDTLGETYTLLDNFSYGGVSYGLPSLANIQGVVYNTAVFEEAGITELPTTPDEFLDALQAIKDNTDAIPLYTNFAAGWTMSAWDAYIDGCATGDPNFINEGLVKGENPFSDRGDGTGPYAVYNTLYEAVSRGLTEDDPTTTDWEGSKGMINNGQIGCMVLGSWALPQMQAAGENADDIAYMPFPISIDGEQYTTEGPDYFYGINVNSSEDEQIAAMCYIKYLVEETDFAETQGGVDCLVDAEFPEALASFQTDTVHIIVNEPAAEGEETLQSDINNESELGINVSGVLATSVVENATTGDKTMNELADEWNAKWTAAQAEFGVAH